MRKFKLLLFILCAFVPLGARAQISWQPNFNLAPAMMQSVILNPCSGGGCNDKPRREPRPSQRPTAALSAASLDYAPSLEVRKRNYAQFTAKIRTKYPVAAANFETFLASQDFVASMGRALKPYGLRTDNLADAFTVYLDSAWLASRGLQDEGNRAKAQALRKQVEAALLNVDALRQATDAMKQEMAETLLIQAALISAAVDQAKADPALMRQVAANVTRDARTLGIDLSSMIVTQNGLQAAR